MRLERFIAAIPLWLVVGVVLARAEFPLVRLAQAQHRFAETRAGGDFVSPRGISATGLAQWSNPAHVLRRNCARYSTGLALRRENLERKRGKEQSGSVRCPGDHV